MKQVLYVVVLVAVALSTATAMPMFGVKAGLNLANVSVENAGSTDYGIRTGLMIGGTADFCLPNPAMSIRGELLYVMKGSKVTYTVGDGTYKLDEVVLAPFFVYRFPMDKFVPFVEIGPELGFVMSHKITSGGTTTDINDYASTDFGLNVGVGASKACGKGIASVDLRYNLGLSNMNTAAAPFDQKMTNNGIQLVLGYAFGSCGGCCGN